MGKRKAKRKAPVKRKTRALETTFTCPFCNHEKAIECKLDREKNIGMLRCRICEVDYQTMIDDLSQPIDVYGDFIDACEVSNAPTR